MGFAAAGIGIASAVVGAVGSIMGGNAKAAQLNYQAQVARNNAIVAEQAADAEIKAGHRQAEMKSLEGAARLGKVKAAQAASGIDVNEGSAVDVQVSERELNKIDTETAMHNAQLRAYGYRSRAVDEKAQAGLYAGGVGPAQTAGYLGAAGSLLSGASQFAGSDFGKDLFGGARAPGSGTIA